MGTPSIMPKEPTPATTPSLPSDASVLNRIYQGKLWANSIIEETLSGFQIRLAEHGHYSKLFQLARITATTRMLDVLSQQTPHPAEHTYDLAKTGFASIIYHAFKNRDSGYITLSSGQHHRAIALSSGLPTHAYSNPPAEAFSELIRNQTQINSETESLLTSYCQEHNASLGAACLHYDLFNVDELRDLVQLHTRMRLIPPFAWTKGNAAFYRDPRFAQTVPACGLSMMELIRMGVWRNLSTNINSVRELTSPHFDFGTKLRSIEQPGAIVWEFNSIENAIMDATTQNQSVEQLVAGLSSLEEQAQYLKSIYILMQIGIIERYVPYSSSMDVKTQQGHIQSQHETEERHRDKKEAVQKIRGYKQMELKARRQLNRRHFDHAARLFETICTRYENPPEMQAYLAIALMSHDPSECHERAQELAKQSLEALPDNPLACAAMSRVLTYVGQFKKAEHYKRQALMLSVENPVWQIELKSFLEPTTKKTLREPNQTMYRPNWASSISIALFAGLFALSIVAGFGDNEHLYQADDWFFWLRRLSLAAAGIAGILLCQKGSIKEILDTEKLGFSVNILMLCLFWAGILGVFTQPQDMTGATWLVATLTIIHVFCEEIFFRRFLTRFLLEYSSSTVAALTLSALAFGIYHLTYYSLWNGVPSHYGKFYWAATISLFAGLPYAWLYWRTNSIVAPFLCHAIANIVTNIRSIN